MVRPVDLKPKSIMIRRFFWDAKFRETGKEPWYTEDLKYPGWNLNAYLKTTTYHPFLCLNYAALQTAKGCIFVLHFPGNNVTSLNNNSNLPWEVIINTNFQLKSSTRILWKFLSLDQLKWFSSTWNFNLSFCFWSRFQHTDTATYTETMMCHAKVISFWIQSGLTKNHHTLDTSIATQNWGSVWLQPTKTMWKNTVHPVNSSSQGW